MSAQSPVISSFLPALLAVFICGCASSRPALVLSPVGPPITVSSSPSAQGTLLVYSAFDTGAPSPSVPDDIRQHTDYELRTEDGKTLQIVANRTGFQGEDPQPVSLPPGNFQVVARANGYGLVTVPVVIAENKITTVHLEGGASWPDPKAFTAANSVRLPGGEIVGWQAINENHLSGGDHRSISN